MLKNTLFLAWVLEVLSENGYTKSPVLALALVSLISYGGSDVHPNKRRTLCRRSYYTISEKVKIL